jgi:hypothetical protein
MSIDDISSDDGSLLSEESNPPSLRTLKLPTLEEETDSFSTVFTNIDQAFGDWERRMEHHEGVIRKITSRADCLLNIGTRLDPNGKD